jgi:hypothetical protein
MTDSNTKFELKKIMLTGFFSALVAIIGVIGIWIKFELDKPSNQTVVLVKADSSKGVSPKTNPIHKHPTNVLRNSKPKLSKNIVLISVRKLMSLYPL